MSDQTIQQEAPDKSGVLVIVSIDELEFLAAQASSSGRHSLANRLSQGVPKLTASLNRQYNAWKRKQPKSDA